MPALSLSNQAIWIITGIAALGVMIRPGRLPEAIWAVGGGVALVATSLLPWREAAAAVLKGTNVYLFLLGMMLLAELARVEGLFDWLAALAARRARGSALRLFSWVYVVGAGVTVLLSNDATAVVLTPAVYAVARAAEAKPLPYLFICAFIANAASFVLPISNPANLVIFGSHLPPLATWLARFSLPSAVSIGITFLSLRLTQRRFLLAPIAQQIPRTALSAGGRLAVAGIVVTAGVLLAASAAEIALGLPTFLAGTLATFLAILRHRAALRPLLRGISWSILPLVAGLFVLVQGLAHTGLLDSLAHVLQKLARHSAAEAAWTVGTSAAVAVNVTNNLPLALAGGTALSAVPLAPRLTAALLIGVDLGPNLSITGSLATVLWLLALRREGEYVSAGSFLRLGVLVMLPALLASLAAAIWLQRW